MTTRDKLNILRDILLDDEREQVSAIDKKIRRLENTLNRKSRLSVKVDPIIDNKLEHFVEEIPETLGPKITETLRFEIKNSQAEVVEALYPIMGKMIKRYIQNEISMLVDRINSNLKKTFSFKNIKKSIKAKFNGKNEAHDLITKQLQPVIEQILVIEKGSGIVISEFSKTQNIDQDMIGGMLTAIKSFAEDAFTKEEERLQQIDYDLFTIHIQNFSSYYMAIVLSGPFNLYYRDRLEDKLLDFAQHVINKSDLLDPDIFSDKLSGYFRNIKLIDS
ncbi:MAG: cell envelope biogenesis protein OmpA [Flavobacteriaceae bacterium]|nr:cell envelope biogenesis protein OmpA [Bacteroidia bacterium]MBT8288860.1 cell envelope biogenesis protein OmpA [Bacteroidia bacterium]NNF74383.1 cell envelope biogenesis protein OmpA [Flavobacteriaceae bacterium]NNK71592.1 cell envelope biogenesis protein OmpA [Flavobacteriaceae bacterium]